MVQKRTDVDPLLIKLEPAKRSSHRAGSLIEGDEDDYFNHLNPKSEYRNSKQIPNQNDPMSKTVGERHPRLVVVSGDETGRRFLFWSFEFKSFGFVSNFDIRISSFPPFNAISPRPTKPFRIHH